MLMINYGLTIPRGIKINQISAHQWVRIKETQLIQQFVVRS